MIVSASHIAARPARRSLLHGFRHAQDGASAVEFALLVPVMMLVMVGMLDFGFNILIRMQLDEALSSATNYAIVSSGEVTASSGPALATKLAAIIPADQDVAISINNGPSLTRTDGTSTTGGSAANADRCWCPTGTPGAISWGSQTTCSAVCPDGSRAGKFVTIALTMDYAPIFTTYGFLSAGPITRSSMVQVK